MKAKTVCLEGNSSPMEAEAWGLKETIIWFGNLGISKVSIELDCKLVVDDIFDSTNNHTEVGNTLHECRMLLDSLPNFKISFIWRKTNFVAHELARVSKLYASYHIFDMISTCIFPTLMNNMI